jgi:flagellar hook-basal body complex protein FliE
MAINPSSAVQAYANALKTLQGGGAAGGDATGAAQGGQSFADMVKDVVSDGIKAGKQAETQAVSGAANKAELVDVVTAITNAELSLQTVVAVRDKVVAAYQDIMKMPI